MGHHVVFLGAGASKESGYPLANGLRLLMSSQDHFAKRLKEYDALHHDSFLARELSEKSMRLASKGVDYLQRHNEALEFFRNGGFATLDEFCKLGSGHGLDCQINRLRCVTRAVLGMFNPEDHFERSEYYPFVQALFDPNNLVDLRDDITVLSYNYDPYLDFLLSKSDVKSLSGRLAKHVTITW